MGIGKEVAMAQMVSTCFGTGQGARGEANAVSHPRHYMGHTGIECMDAMRSMMGSEGVTFYWEGCAFKYLWRWRAKNGVEDLKKARQCLDYLIETVEGGAK